MIRLLLLGASNLTLGLPHVLAAARRSRPGRPLDVLIAAGHGRCYGCPSRYLARGLPAILGCGLWRAAEEAPAVETLALITDVGNDLMSGASGAGAAALIEESAARLGRLGATTTLTGLPIGPLRRLGPWRYLVLRTLLYPGRRLPRSLLLARAGELDRRLAALADANGLALARPHDDWFGGDGIHIRRGRRAAAWRELLAGWGRAEEVEAPAAPPPRPVGTGGRGAAPERFTMLGFERRRSQPSARLADGSRLSLY